MIPMIQDVPGQTLSAPKCDKFHLLLGVSD